MNLLLAIVVQAAAVVVAIVLLCLWLSPYAGGLLAAAVAFRAGLEIEKRA